MRLADAFDSKIRHDQSSFADLGHDAVWRPTRLPAANGSQGRRSRTVQGGQSATRGMDVHVNVDRALQDRTTANVLLGTLCMCLRMPRCTPRPDIQPSRTVCSAPSPSTGNSSTTISSIRSTHALPPCLPQTRPKVVGSRHPGRRNCPPSAMLWPASWPVLPSASSLHLSNISRRASKCNMLSTSRRGFTLGQSTAARKL